MRRALPWFGLLLLTISFVRLVRADANTYCLEDKKTQQTYFLAGPGGTVAPGSC